MGDTFDALLAGLAAQHRREITEVLQPLQEENQKLKNLVRKLESQLSEEQQKPSSKDENLAEIGRHEPFLMGEKHDQNGLRLTATIASNEGAFPPVAKRLSWGVPHAVPEASPTLGKPENDSTQFANESRIRRTERAISDFDTQERQRHKDRLRGLMGLTQWEEHITPKHIREALSKKAPTTVIEQWSEEKLRGLMTELSQLNQTVGRRPSKIRQSRDDKLSLQTFVNMLLLPDLASRIKEDYADVQNLQEHLLKEDMNDVMLKVTKSHGSNSNPEEEAPKKVDLRKLNFVVGSAVVVSLLILGVSLDHWPESIGWIIIEAVITLIFVAELAIKTHVFGCKEYFTGPEYQFNNLDAFITGLAIADVAVSFVAFGDQLSTDVSASRLAMVARVLRLARITRLVKAVNVPMFRQLANMLSGFAIALPTLAWILVLMFLWLYLVGVLFRTLVGPSPGQDLMSECPAADDITSEDPLQCKIHYLYGEEFFDSVPNSMFTIFRCVIGDCSSAGGRSLAANFSQGYGTRFIVAHYLGMILVIFGLFNVINAIFVESVITGLKRNDVQKRFQQVYDRRYVHRKLNALLERLKVLFADDDKSESDHIQNGSSKCSASAHEELSFTEEDYGKIVRDDVCSSIFDDLDVTQYNREGLFDVFDVDGNGVISEAELMKTLIMLRGEPQKSDAVSAFVAIKSLRDRIRQWQVSLLDNQRQMLQNQKQILEMTARDGLNLHVSRPQQ